MFNTFWIVDSMNCWNKRAARITDACDSKKEDKRNKHGKTNKYQVTKKPWIRTTKNSRTGCNDMLYYAMVHSFIVIQWEKGRGRERPTFIWLLNRNETAIRTSDHGHNNNKCNENHIIMFNDWDCFLCVRKVIEIMKNVTYRDIWMSWYIWRSAICNDKRNSDAVNGCKWIYKSLFNVFSNASFGLAYSDHIWRA